MESLREIKVFERKHAESGKGLSNWRGDFRDIAELTSQVYLRLDCKFVVLRKKIKLFHKEHAESAIEVSNSPGDFRDVAELTFKVYLRMESQRWFSLRKSSFWIVNMQKVDRGLKFAWGLRVTRTHVLCECDVNA